MGQPQVRRAYEKEVSIASLRWPGFYRYAKKPDVEGYAQDIQERGKYDLPIISGESGQLLLGTRTVAALYALGHKRVTCKVVWREDVDSDTKTIPVGETVASPGSMDNVQGFRRDLETFGLEVTERWEAELNVLQLLHHKASMAVRYSMQYLQKLHASPTPNHGTEPLQELVRTAWTAIDMASPAGLCPYCKGLPFECSHCGSVRWVGSATLADTPDELLDDEDLVVEYQGEVITYVSARRKLGLE